MKEEIIFNLSATNLRDHAERPVEIDEKTIVGKLLSLWCREKVNRTELEERWKKSFDAFMLRPIIPNPKYPWQSKLVLPHAFRYVEMGVSRFRKAVLSSGKFFSFMPLIPELEGIAPHIEKLVLHYINTSNFYTAFESALKYGFITSFMVIEPTWKRDLIYVGDEAVPVETVEYETLDVFNVIIDEDNRYIFKRKYLPKHNISSLMKLGYYDSVPIDSYPQIEAVDEETRQRLYYDFNIKEDYCEVIDFCGTFYDGDEYYYNYEVSILNRQHIIRLRPLLNWLNKPLTVSAQFYRALKGVYGLSLVDTIISLLQEMTLLYRMTSDNALLALGGIIEIAKQYLDEATVENIEKHGLDPFMMLLREGMPNAQAVYRTAFSEFNPNILPVIQMMKNDMDSTTPALHEVALGLPTSKGRPTAKEIMAKMGQSGEILSSVAERIEKDILSQIIINTACLILQYESDAKIGKIIGADKLSMLNKIGRKEILKMLITDCGIKIDTITLFLQRQEALQKILNFIEITNQMPNRNRINYDYIAREFAVLLGLSPTDVFMQESEQEKQKEMLAVKMISDFVLQKMLESSEGGQEFISEIAKKIAEKVSAVIDLRQIVDVVMQKGGANNGRAQEA